MTLPKAVTDAQKNGPPRRREPKQKPLRPATTVVMCRISGVEKEAIEVAAEASDLTVSSFMRSLCLEGAGVKPFLNYHDRMLFKSLAEEFRAVGVNLNQIARAINAKREVHPDEVLMALNNVHTMMGVVGYEVRELSKRGPSRRREAE